MYPDHTAYQFRELLHSKSPADVVIFGSSTAVHGYVPSILSGTAGLSCDFKRTFNFGMMGAQPTFYLQWYRLLFRRFYRAPSLVIVSLDWFSAGAAHGDLSHEQIALAQDSRYLPWSVFFTELRQAQTNHDRAVLLKNLVRVMGIGPDVRYFFMPHVDAGMAGYDRGYMPLDTHIDLAIGGDRAFAVNDAFLHDLSSLIEDIQAQGSSVLLVQMPIYDPQSIQGLAKSSAFADLARAHHVTYLDYNGERRSALNAQADAFGDWSHLSRTGSEIFSTMLRRDLSHMTGLCAQ
jgi:hypothetical protein